ncbi:Efflux pump roqT [Lachnellula suecica]|uniref:Efflux pump roqT n=1 Tax=Lachnellula suecica TaxID=602035 RepID=A0A8T9C8S7_9HELO|nr:Efflux pump roqT [Lachnellula suecica]
MEKKEPALSDRGGASPIARDQPILPTWRLVCLTISVCFGLFLSLLDTTIVATALYTIGVDLNALETVTWVALSYTLSYLGCAVIFARIGDICGRRNAYIAAFIIFFAFSLGCGFAQTLNQLIACRALQGIGGSGLYSLTFVILAEVSPRNEKLGRTIGALAGFVVAVAGVLGPVLGGVITHYTTWRWVFWINLPIGLVPLIMFVIAWPKAHQLVHAPRRSWKELDILGCILLIAATVLVVFSFQQAGIRDNAWKQPIFIVPLVIGLLCAFFLFCWEVAVARYWEDKIATMFPLRLMRRRVYMGYVLSTLLTGFPYFTVMFSLPIRMQVVGRKTALMAGLSLLPMLGTVALGTVLGGAINGNRDLKFPTLVVATIFMTIGCAALSTVEATGGLQGGIYGFQVFAGLGFGTLISTVSMAASLECEIRDNTVAQGIIAQVRILGGSIGIAASTAILGASQRRNLSGLVSASELASLQTFSQTASTEQLLAIRKTYSDAFSTDMKVSAAVAGLAVLGTLVTFRTKKVDVQARFNERIIEEGERMRTMV